jgi:hypothetical protein
MPPRNDFKRLNHLFDVKHIALDFNKAGISDEQVYQEAVKLHRLIITFNGDDFEDMARKSTTTGIISLSNNLTPEQIDTKLVALLVRSTSNSLYGKFTTITGETVF